MAVYTFPPGEHDEFVCGHILRGRTAPGPVEHTYNADGSVTVDFPGLTEQQIADALATYSRAAYENRPQPKPFDVQKVMLHARLRALES